MWMELRNISYTDIMLARLKNNIYIYLSTIWKCISVCIPLSPFCVDPKA